MSRFRVRGIGRTQPWAVRLLNHLHLFIYVKCFIHPKYHHGLRLLIKIKFMQIYVHDLQMSHGLQVSGKLPVLSLIKQSLGPSKALKFSLLEMQSSWRVVKGDSEVGRRDVKPAKIFQRSMHTDLYTTEEFWALEYLLFPDMKKIAFKTISVWKNLLLN